MNDNPFLSRGKIVIMIFFSLLALTFLMMHLYERNVESKIDKCLSDLLNQNGFSELTIKTKDRYKSPILSGSTTAFKHKKVLKLLNGQCEIEELNDLVNIIIDPNEKLARVEFETDEFNNTVSISGQLSHQDEVNEVLQIVKSSYPEAVLMQNLQVDETIENSNIAINLTLALSQIEEIELTELTLTDQEIIIKGLVRDMASKIETINNFRELFNDELNITDQLEEVLKKEAQEKIKQIDLEADDIELDFNKVPTLVDPEDIDN